MNIKDLDLSFVKNKNHNVKHVLFVNNETTEVVPAIKVSPFSNALKDVTDYIHDVSDMYPELKTDIICLFGRHGDRDSNLSSPTTRTLERWVAVNKAGMYLFNRKDFDKHFSELEKDPENAYIPIGANERWKVKVTNKQAFLKALE